MSEVLASISVAVAAVVLLYAAISDWRTREIPDGCWWVLGTSGIILTGIRVMSDGFDVGYLMMLIGSFMILVDIASEKEWDGHVKYLFYAVMAAMFVIPYFLDHGKYLAELYIIPICFAIFYVLFILGILRGGADAKCFIVTAMMFQTYPVFFGCPLISLPSDTAMLVISFPLALLFHAALFAVVGMLAYGIVNMSRNKVPLGMRSMFWKRMSVNEAESSHVWPKQDIVNGEIVYLSDISDDKGVYDRFRSRGVSDIWVTPIIPFLVPTFAAFLFLIFIGNILFIPF